MNISSLLIPCKPCIMKQTYQTEASMHATHTLNIASSTANIRSEPLQCWTYLRSIKSHVHLWRRHQMETGSVLLAIFAGNSPVIGKFPAQKPVTRSFDVFFDMCVNKRFSKQSWAWWFETPSCSLWRHCNVFIISQSWGCWNRPSCQKSTNLSCMSIYASWQPRDGINRPTKGQ